jgi:hypothetical protein
LELKRKPRLLSIELRTFRHRGNNDSTLYQQQRLNRKEAARIKGIENTMKYIDMVHFKDGEFEVTMVTTVEEAKRILSSSFDYIIKKNGIIQFRRPKRFSEYVS